MLLNFADDQDSGRKKKLSFQRFQKIQYIYIPMINVSRIILLRFASKGILRNLSYAEIILIA